MLSALALVGVADATPATAGPIRPTLKVDRPKYRMGHEVWVHAQGFDGRLVIDFTITGLPASCKAGKVVAEDVVKANRRGTFDEIFYMVQWDDCGWYEITAREGRKEARPVMFKVKGPGAPPDEAEDEPIE